VREAAYTAETGRALLGAVADLCQLAGWVASDAGLSRRAERYHLGGLRAAHAARDAPLAANLLSTLSYQAANVGDPREAVLLATGAYTEAEGRAPPVARALLLERVAWANARVGDVRATESALGAAGDAFAAAEPDSGPPWAYWLTAGEVDRAAAVATRVAELSAGVASVRTRERVLLLRRLLQPYRGQEDVDAFEEQVHLHR
jgi:hypothetical protein